MDTSLHPPAVSTDYCRNILREVNNEIVFPESGDGIIYKCFIQTTERVDGFIYKDFKNRDNFQI